ncbi:MAG: hypothetical protein AUG93_00910 [Armatimonadetes bacterium 13_1_20CM_4_65_7]|nr:MAG: hypothetical protein AUG93_00910 [Armatimonadetes bacterium 13_1_20CM_4_65_7]
MVAPSNPYGWLILVLLLLLSAFFSAAEAALLAANKLRLRRLRDDGDRRAHGWVPAGAPGWRWWP